MRPCAMSTGIRRRNVHAAAEAENSSRSSLETLKRFDVYNKAPF